MTILDFSWMDDERYIHIENGAYVVNSDAPEEVKEAYQRYLEQVKAAAKRGAL